jgi:hypothetical protein
MNRSQPLPYNSRAKRIEPAFREMVTHFVARVFTHPKSPAPPRHWPVTVPARGAK